MAEKNFRFVGSGIVRMALFQSTKPLLRIGTCSALSITVNEQELSLPNYESPGGGKAASLRRVESVQASMTLHDFRAENIARATRGKVIDADQGSISNEPHTAYIGGLIRLDRIDPSTVVVTNDGGTVTYTAGEDYRVTAAGVEIMEDGAVADGSTVKISYAHTAQRIIEAITDPALEYYLTLEGQNEAQGNRPYVIDLWRFQPGFARNLDAIKTDDFAGMEITGELLADTTRPAGQSQFFRWTQVES